MRNLAADLPSSVSQVHWTSFAVNGCPSCQRTLSRKRKVSSVPSSFHDQPVARSGTIDCSEFCGTCWSKMTRLLNTAIIGATVEIVTSSSVDMLAGLSRWATWSTPPAFCANAVSDPMRATTNTLAAITFVGFMIIHSTPVPVNVLGGYFSTQTSSIRQPLKMLLTMIVSPLT